MNSVDHPLIALITTSWQARLRAEEVAKEYERLRLEAQEKARQELLRKQGMGRAFGLLSPESAC